MSNVDQQSRSARVACGLQTGLIGWFDILGYGTLMSSPARLPLIIDLIGGVISKIPSEATQRIRGIANHLPGKIKQEQNDVESLLKSVKWAIFADTVVLSVAFEQPECLDTSFMRVSMFMEMALDIQCGLFGCGLPARGAISYGHFYIHESVPLFAGKPFATAHYCAESQEWSGCVFTTSGASVLTQLAARLPPNTAAEVLGYALPYAVECKDAKTKERIKKPILCLDWPSDIKGFTTATDLLTFIQTQFARHGKGTSKGDVERKIQNTHAFFLYSRNRADGGSKEFR